MNDKKRNDPSANVVRPGLDVLATQERKLVFWGVRAVYLLYYRCLRSSGFWKTKAISMGLVFLGEASAACERRRIPRLNFQPAASHSRQPAQRLLLPSFPNSWHLTRGTAGITKDL